MRVLTLVCLAALIPSALFAVVPDPGLSTVPPCIRVYPTGALTLTGQVIGNNNLPLGNNDVRLVFSASCTGLLECPLPGVQPTVITTVADGSGNYSFTPEAGGCCSAAISASIEADPGSVTLQVYGNIGSPDNTGDLGVTLGDFVNFQTDFALSAGGTGSETPCSDIAGDCDNYATLGDFVAFQGQFQTTCL